MDTSSVTTNTLDTSCFGTFQVASDGFETCVQMNSSSPYSFRYSDDKTFVVNPKYNFSYSIVYRIRITTGTKDSSGNSLTSQWITSSGFQTEHTDHSNKPVITSMTQSGYCSINIKGEDDYGITHFIVSQSSTTPSVTSNNWIELNSVKTQIDIKVEVSLTGRTLFYGWLKDTGNNISTRMRVFMTHPSTSHWVCQ